MKTHEKIKTRFNLNKRKAGLAGGLAFMLMLMQIAGWQRSMKYGTSMHTSPLFQKIAMPKCQGIGGLFHSGCF